MKDKKSKRIILHFALSFCILIFTFCIFLMPVFAAEINVIPLNWEVGLNQTLEVNISLSAEKESINAVSGEVKFPEEILELKEIKDGNSIISFWVEKPRKEGNRIIFAGIIPGGFDGDNGLLFSLVFKTKREGGGIIGLQNMESFYNDGQGTKAPLKIFQLAFAVKKGGIAAQMPAREDEELPETFKPEIANDPALFEGKWFVVFATQDKSSGIDRYEIRETRYKILGVRKWRTAESPYVLSDQKLRSYVWIKAVDKAGNKQIVSLPPKYPLKWYEMYEIWSIIILGLGVAYLIKKILWKKKISH